MKVERGSKSVGGTGASGARGPAEEKGSRVESKAFVEALGEAADRAVESDLDKLFEKIREQSEILVKRPTDTELTKFREQVSEFMKSVLEKGVKVTEIPSARFAENSKVFILARRIEEKLLTMAEEVHSGIPDAMKIATACSEIRGLLLDMRS